MIMMISVSDPQATDLQLSQPRLRQGRNKESTVDPPLEGICTPSLDYWASRHYLADTENNPILLAQPALYRFNDHRYRAFWVGFLRHT